MSLSGVDPLSVLAAFAFGALSFVSPCVLPLLPGYLSMMSGYSAVDLTEGKTSTRRMLRVTLLFVAGFTVVFMSLGAAFSSVSKTLLRNQDTLATVGGWIVLFMGLFLAVTAIWTPRFLLPMMQERRVEVRPSRLGAWAPPVMGAAFGFGWTPCIGPTLASILILTQQGQGSGNVVGGMFLLFVYSMGLGLPFVLAGVGMSKALSFFSWLRRHLKPITVVSGLLLAVFGLLMITGNLTDLNRWFQRNVPELPWNV